MDAGPALLLAALGRAALLQLVAAGLLAWWMRSRWHAQPRACRLACVLVLLQGWLVAPLTVAVPWYEPAPAAAGPQWTAVAAGAPGDGQAAVSSSSAEPRDTQQPAQGPRSFSVVAAWVWAGRWAGRLALFGWAAGVAVMVLCMPLRYFRFLRSLPPLRPAEGVFLDEWQNLLTQHRMRRAIPLYVTDDVGPMLVRLPRGPAVLVPAELWQTISPAARHAILRHELAHYLWGDPWKSLWVRLLAVPQWFNPAARWAERMYQQCGERLCDRFAAHEPAERLHYAQALRQLALLRLPVHAVGQCAQSHPLVGRVRLLLQSREEEKSVMRSTLTIALAAAVLAVGAVRVKLVAQEVTRESAKAKIEALDQRLAEVQAKIDEFKEIGPALKEKVEAKTAQLKELHGAGQFSQEAVRRHGELESGDPAKAIAALDDVASLGDEGLILLAMASRSSDEAVRRKVIDAALSLGPDGFPVLAFAVKSGMTDGDRIYLAEQAMKDLTPERMIALAGLAKESSPEVRNAVIGLACKSPQRVVLLAVIGKHLEDQPEAIERMIAKAPELEGDDGLLLLYAVARHGTPAQQIAALKASVARKEQAVPVLAAAGKSQTPEVRAELVRTAKAIGGKLGDYIVEKALADPDEAVRQAAEKALQPPEAEK